MSNNINSNTNPTINDIQVLKKGDIQSCQECLSHNINKIKFLRLRN